LEAVWFFGKPPAAIDVGGERACKYLPQITTKAVLLIRQN